jgi:signal transduction histidine kinase
VDRTDVTAVTESAVALVEGEVRRHARIVRQYGRAPEVMANEGRLAQVSLNLLQNAAQAIPRGSGEAQRIIVSTGTDADGNAFIEVHDTGCGIPPENLARIFEPFFTTKPIGVGTGLGLPICQRIVASMGGRIEVKSEVGVGSVFRVVIPPAPPASSSRAPVTPSGPPSSRGRGSR